MTKAEAIRQLREIEGFIVADIAADYIKKNLFKKLEEFLASPSVNEYHKRVDNIIRNYLRSRKLKLLSND